MWLEAIESAGSVFLGYWTPESVGDYCSGSNHVLPTYGWARSYSGVSVASFQKQITVQDLRARRIAQGRTVRRPRWRSGTAGSAPSRGRRCGCPRSMAARPGSMRDPAHESGRSRTPGNPGPAALFFGPHGSPGWHGHAQCQRIGHGRPAPAKPAGIVTRNRNPWNWSRAWRSFTGCAREQVLVGRGSDEGDRPAGARVLLPPAAMRS